MRRDLPPPVRAYGEVLPADFAGKVRWLDRRFSGLLLQAAEENKSMRHHMTGEPIARAAAFSARLRKLLEINDPDLHASERERYLWTLSPTPARHPHNRVGSQHKQACLVSWKVVADEVVPDSFAESSGQNREVALRDVLEVLRAPDLAIVDYSEAFPDE